MPVLLVEIEEQSIRLAYGYKNKNVVEHCTQNKMSNVIKDDEIIDKYVLTGIIKDHIKKREEKIKNVAIIIKSPNAILKSVDINKIDPKEANKVFQSNIKSYMPIDLSKYTVDYKLINNNKFLVVAVPNDIIYGYIRFFQEMRLTVVHIDVIQNCITKIFQEKQNVYILAFMRLGSNLAIIDIVDGNIEKYKEIIFDENLIYHEINKLLDSTPFDEICVLGNEMDFIVKHLEPFDDIKCKLYNDEEMQSAAFSHVMTML